VWILAGGVKRKSFFSEKSKVKVMRRRKELVFALLCTLTSCTAIRLNLWDPNSENWKDFECASQRGTCLAVEVAAGNYRVMSAYISKGTRLTIHSNSIGHRSENNITIFVKAGEIPTPKEYDFKLSGRDPGFSQFSCYGVMLYWQLQLDANNISKRNKVNIGITLTVDDCIQKNYMQACPKKWLATSGGWCQPPKDYKGPCHSQNYFGTQRIGNGFSVPSSWEYKMLWSERCGADWPCDVFVSSKCAPLLHNLYQGKWRKLNHKKEISDFGSFQLLPNVTEKHLYLFFVDIPPGSSVLIKVIPTPEPFLRKFKGASTKVSSKSVLMMSVSQSESEQYKSEEALISWQKSLKGGLLQISIINVDCPRWSRFFFALRNLNKFMETVRSISIIYLYESFML